MAQDFYAPSPSSMLCPTRIHAMRVPAARRRAAGREARRTRYAHARNAIRASRVRGRRQFPLRDTRRGAMAQPRPFAALRVTRRLAVSPRRKVVERAIRETRTRANSPARYAYAVGGFQEPLERAYARRTEALPKSI